MNATPILHRGLVLAIALSAGSAANAQLPRVALVGAESSVTSCNFLDPQAWLLNTGRFAVVDVFNATLTGGATPLLSQLQGYDAVLCWTDDLPADHVALGNVLADYVDSGGGVVVALFANSTAAPGGNLDGRWQNGYQVILDRGGEVTGPGALESVFAPNHPVMAGVTAFAGNAASARPAGTSLEAGATLLATWGGGKVLAAAGSNPKRIDLGFFPSSCSPAGWAVGGGLLLANALEYVARIGYVRAYGTGCAGSLGVPVLQAAPGVRPALGSTFSATLSNLPLDAGIVLVGWSDRRYGPYALPMNLTIFGLAGCDLLAEPVASLFLAGSSHSAAWTFGIPTDPSWLGADVFSQALVLDAAVNPAHLTTSNGARLRIGN